MVSSSISAFDDTIYQWFYHMRVAGLDPWIAAWTTSMRPRNLVVLIGVLALWNRHRRWIVLAVTTASTAVGVELLKLVVQRARPPAEFQLVEATSYSFPSGHAATIAAIAMTITLLWSRRSVHILAWSVALLLAASRLYVGIHWATDVCAGLVLGSVWSLSVTHIMTRNAWKQ
ncbi:phosphatase PAP2 family protein [Corynebacterium sp. HS2168-gen11]|uniref:phosphatase PAP2 family protein n=1 Tax=Corynebacterium sp. HS2168-gen11 TaxID=2974027 RepID=UPI00216AC13D|nr:phosphatase PAP2 family protein [Corynebacterium sp. HS2168-gen11]MCS4535965.1 phosphatase PAP2 family protein [Corynebacterium sp. HS2168-gen11]